MKLSERFQALTESKMLIGIIIMLISAWASWSTTAIIRASEQRAQIREHVQKNMTNNESIRKRLDEIQATVNKILDMELERSNAK